MIELMVAMTLAVIATMLINSVWRSFDKTVHSEYISQADIQKAEMLMTQIESKIMQSKGLTFFSPHEIHFLNQNDQEEQFLIEDDTLIFLNNDTLLPQFPLKNISFFAIGLRFFREDPNISPDILEKDMNEDGYLDFDELDQDFSYDLDLKELKYVSGVGCQFYYGRLYHKKRRNWFLRNHQNPPEEKDEFSW